LVTDAGGGDYAAGEPVSSNDAVRSSAESMAEIAAPVSALLTSWAFGAGDMRDLT
jgi:hypothetical protein